MTQSAEVHVGILRLCFAPLGGVLPVKGAGGDSHRHLREEFLRTGSWLRVRVTVARGFLRGGRGDSHVSNPWPPTVVAKAVF